MSGDKIFQVPFDQYQRYKKTSEIIGIFRDEKETFTILEIGANAHKNLNQFLPNDTISYLDIELPENLLNDPQYILGDATNMTFLKDEQFDIVIALDVFEHIPQELRQNFLKEMNRVSKILFILAGPFDTEGVHQIEVETNDFYKEKYGDDYIWLKEHIFNKLPALHETIIFLRSISVKIISNYSHGSLDLWKKIFLSHFEVSDNTLLQNIRQQLIDNFYNEYIYEFDISDNNYRQFIIGSKSKEISCSVLFESDINSIDEKLLNQFYERIESIFLLSSSNLRPHEIELFLEKGEGTSEETSIKFPVSHDTKIQKSVFDLSQQTSLHAMRLDPLNDTCVIKIETLELILENEVFDLLPFISTNACAQDGNCFFFDSNDSQIYFSSLDVTKLAAVKELKVIILFLHIGKDALHACIEKKEQQIQEKELQIHKKNLEIIHLITLAQSLRLKNRLKNILKKYLPHLIIQYIKALKNLNIIEYFKERKRIKSIELSNIKSSIVKNKIIIVSHDANKQGAPLLALYLAKHLNKFFNYDVVTILAKGGDLQSEFEKYSFVYRFDVLKEQEQINIIKNLSENNFSLSICNTSVVGDIVEKLSLNGMNTISLLHELPYVIKVANLDESIKKIINNATKIVFPSIYVKNKVAALFQFEENKIEICHQGRYMTNDYKFDKVDAKRKLCEKLNINENSNIVLNIGRGEFRKGFDLFIDTAIQVLKTLDNIYFVWVGNCDEDIYRDALEKIDENNLRKRILFIKFDQDIGLYYSGSDLFYLSSREDPFPSVFIDAVSAGLAVIAYENGGGFTDYMKKISGTLISNFDTKKATEFICNYFTNQNFRKSYESKFMNLEQDFGFNDYIFNILEIADKVLPKVSVIVPNYNYEKYIEMRLNSIFNQTIKPYEIIFLDDNSKDNSLKIAEKLLEESGLDYRIIANDTNIGCYNQWLKGIKEAKGDIIWIAEADDLCKENFIEKLIPKFDDADISLVYAQSIAIDESSNEMDFSYIEYTKELSADRWLHDFTNKGKDEIVNYLAKLNTIPNASGVLIRKTALENIEQHISQYTSTGDWFVYIYVLQHGNIAFCSEKLNFHRRHSKSIIQRVMHEPKLLKEIILISKYTYDNFEISKEDIKLLIKRFNDYYNLLPNRKANLFEDNEFKEYFKNINFEYFWNSYIKP